VLGFQKKKEKVLHERKLCEFAFQKFLESPSERSWARGVQFARRFLGTGHIP
jgi:hypothetical protein